MDEDCIQVRLVLGRFDRNEDGEIDTTPLRVFDVDIPNNFRIEDLVKKLRREFGLHNVSRLCLWSETDHYLMGDGHEHGPLQHRGCYAVFHSASHSLGLPEEKTRPHNEVGNWPDIPTKIHSRAEIIHPRDDYAATCQ